MTAILPLPVQVAGVRNSLEVAGVIYKPPIGRLHHQIKFARYKFWNQQSSKRNIEMWEAPGLDANSFHIDYHQILKTLNTEQRTCLLTLQEDMESYCTWFKSLFLCSVFNRQKSPCVMNANFLQVYLEDMSWSTASIPVWELYSM